MYSIQPLSEKRITVLLDVMPNPIDYMPMVPATVMPVHACNLTPARSHHSFRALYLPPLWLLFPQQQADLVCCYACLLILSCS